MYGLMIALTMIAVVAPSASAAGPVWYEPLPGDPTSPPPPPEPPVPPPPPIPMAIGIGYRYSGVLSFDGDIHGFDIRASLGSFGLSLGHETFVRPDSWFDYHDAECAQWGCDGDNITDDPRSFWTIGIDVWRRSGGAEITNISGVQVLLTSPFLEFQAGFSTRESTTALHLNVGLPGIRVALCAIPLEIELIPHVGMVAPMGPTIFGDEPRFLWGIGPAVSYVFR